MGRVEKEIKKVNEKLTTSQFIDRSKILYGDRFDYSKTEYKNAHKRVIIICSIHGEFNQVTRRHTDGHHGCKPCSNKERSESQSMGIKAFVERAQAVHNYKYDYSTTNYTNIDAEIEIICPNHGKFLQLACNHLNGHGCRTCVDRMPYTNESFIAKSNLVHKNKYCYDKVEYVGVFKKVIIICPKHGDFLQRPSAHMGGHGCRKCSPIISKPETEWLDSLGIKVRNHTIWVGKRRFNVDGFLPETMTVFDFLGSYYHGDPRLFNSQDINPTIKKTYGDLYKKTMKRKEALEAGGYTVVHMWESEFNEKMNIKAIKRELKKKKR